MKTPYASAASVPQTDIPRRFLANHEGKIVSHELLDS